MSLEHAILGFLSVTPMSGYDLKRVFDETVAHFWTADQAQIYRTLSRLVKDGLVERDHIEQVGRPARNEHRLTETGRDRLDTWLASPPEPQPTRQAFLLKMFFGGRLGVDAAKRLLAERVELARESLAELMGIAAAVEAETTGNEIGLDQRLRTATLDNGIIHTQAEIEWATNLLDLLDQEPQL